MNDQCPICGRKANAEKVFENTQGYTNKAGKFAVKQGGKYVGKNVGSVIGSFFGAPEIGEAIGGIAGSYFAGAGADEYANTHGAFHYRYNHCGVGWVAKDNEFSIINNYWDKKETNCVPYNKKHDNVSKYAAMPLLFLTLFPYMALFALLIVCVVMKISLFIFLIGKHPVAWAWGIISWWFLHTWWLIPVTLALMIFTLVWEADLKKKEIVKIRNSRMNFLCRKYNLHIGKIEFADGATYEGTLTSTGNIFGYGTYTFKDGEKSSGAQYYTN